MDTALELYARGTRTHGSLRARGPRIMNRSVFAFTTSVERRPYEHKHRSEATTYLGGNCEFGTGVARLAVGAVAVNPMTAQLMSTPAAP